MSNRPVAGETEITQSSRLLVCRHARSLIQALLCLALTLAVYFLHDRFKPLTDAEARMVDWRLRGGRMTPMDGRLVYLRIDRPGYAEDFPVSTPIDGSERERRLIELLRGDFPWTREVFALVSDKLMRAGARGVLFNFVFSSEKEQDLSFKSVLDQYRPRVVLGALIEATENTTQFIPPSHSLIEPDAFGDNLADPRVALLNIQSDADGQARHGLYADGLFALIAGAATEDPGPLVYTLAARGMALLGHSNVVPKGTARPLFRYSGPAGAFPAVSLKQIAAPMQWHDDLAGGAFFRDKLVLVGPGPEVFDDRQATPLGDMETSELHLNLINAGLHAGFIAETNLPTDRAVVLGAGVALLLLALGLRRPGWRIGVAIAISAAHLCAAMWIYNRQNLMLHAVATPILLLMLGTTLSLLLDRLTPPPAFALQAKPGPADADQGF